MSRESVTTSPPRLASVAIPAAVPRAIPHVIATALLLGALFATTARASMPTLDAIGTGSSATLLPAGVSVTIDTARASAVLHGQVRRVGDRLLAARAVAARGDVTHVIDVLTVDGVARDAGSLANDPARAWTNSGTVDTRP